MQVLIASVDYVPNHIHSEWEQLLQTTVRELSRTYKISIPYETRINNNKVEFRLLNVPLLDWYKDTQVKNEVVNKITYNLTQFLGVAN